MTGQSVHPHEPELLLPPWSRQRRRLAAIVMISFILLVSGLIGVGVYQVGIQLGFITKPFSKESLTQSLLADASFLRAVKQAVNKRECSNPLAHFQIRYESPFRPLATSGVDACFKFVALHPTGADVLVSITSEAVPRHQLAATLSAAFTSVHADLISGTGYETTQLSGILHGISTTIYIVRTDINRSWIITYAPTSPTLDPLVRGMVEAFHVSP